MLRRLLSLFYTVIGDRCLVDFIAWMIVMMDHLNFPGSTLGRFLVRLAAKEKAIYVKASQTELLNQILRELYD